MALSLRPESVAGLEQMGLSAQFYATCIVVIDTVMFVGFVLFAVLIADAHHFFPRIKALAAEARARILLAQGDVAGPVQWAEASGLSTDDSDLNYIHEREYLTLARVQIAQGRADPAGPYLSDALMLLARLLVTSEAHGRMGSALEMRILRALAFDAHGERGKALATLERALTFAEPEGYIRLFIDEGMSMQTLLRQAQARGMAPDYVSRLLASFDAQYEPDTVPAVSPNGALIEPLTERELEVLHLLDAGASNSDIARCLVVSVNTLKRHVYNICSKLGVQSRTQALARARALHLL